MKIIFLLLVVQLTLSCSAIVQANPTNREAKNLDDLFDQQEQNHKSQLQILEGLNTGLVQATNQIQALAESIQSANQKLDDLDRRVPAAESSAPTTENGPVTAESVGFNRLAKLDDDFEVVWRTCGRTKTITFGITAKTSGFVGFGISPSGKMNNSDVVIGGVSNGVAYFGDYHVSGRVPTRDRIQNWNLLAASENTTHTNLIVSRPLDTADTDDIPIESNGNTIFIWSIGQTDVIGRHRSHGNASVNIFDGVTYVLNTTESNPASYSNDRPEIRPEYRRSLELNDDFKVEWNTCGRSKTVTFKITAKTLGYVAFGLSPTGQKNDSDILIAGVNNGENYVLDFHGTESNIPALDSSQDWTLEFASEDETQTTTTLVVSRKFDTGDSHDVQIHAGTTNFIWAIGETDDIPGRHKKHGSAVVDILSRETNALVNKTI